MGMFWASAPARAIAALFDSDPDGWTCDDYNARNTKRDIKIWIANKAYALDVKCAGVRLYGFCFPWGSADQIHIWRAFKRWRSNQVVRSLAKETGQ